MGKTLHRGIDSFSNKGRKDTLKQPDKIGEDYENIPKKSGITHQDTWKYKRGYVESKVLQRMLKKHVNEPFQNVYATIAERYKVGSLERLHLERDLVWMSHNDPQPYFREGYMIIDGIIRRVQKVKGEYVVIK